MAPRMHRCECLARAQMKTKASIAHQSRMTFNTRTSSSLDGQLRSDGRGSQTSIRHWRYGSCWLLSGSAKIAVHIRYHLMYSQENTRSWDALVERQTYLYAFKHAFSNGQRRMSGLRIAGRKTRTRVASTASTPHARPELDVAMSAVTYMALS